MNESSNMAYLRELDSVSPLVLPQFGKSPLYFEAGGGIFQSPDFNVIYNKENSRPVGTFKNGFKLHDPRSGVDAVESMLGSGDIDLSGISREMETSHNQAQLKITWTIPSVAIEIGLNDICAMQIVHKNSWNGAWSWSVSYRALRLACLNGMMIPSQVWQYKRKNTKSLDPSDAKKRLGDMVARFKEIEPAWKKWRETRINKEWASSIIAKTAETKSPQFGMQSLAEFHESRAVKANASYNYIWNRYSNHESREAGLGETLWGLFNSMTYWATHAPASREADEGNILSIRDRRHAKVSTIVSGADWWRAAA